MDPQTEQSQPVTPQSAPHDQLAAAAAPPLTPLYQTDAWHLPDGHFSIFGYRQCVIVVYPGWLVVYRKGDHAELQRIPLGGDLRMKYFLNYARFVHINGQKISMFNQKYSFFLVTIWSYALFFVGVLINTIYRWGTLGAYPDPGQDLLVQGAALLFMLASIAWMATGLPKSKAFVQACKHAAGIA